MPVRLNVRFAGAIVGAILLVGAIACGNSSSPAPGGAAATPVATDSDVDFALAGVDPSHLCFDASSLPAGFAPDGASVLDIPSAATAINADPDHGAQDLQAWSYVTGAYSQWALSGEAAQTQVAAQTTRYISAMCFIEFFQHTTGAHQAFAATHDEELREIPAGVSSTTLHQGKSPGIGVESVSYEADLSGIESVDVTFRSGNVVSRLSVTGVCRTGGCAELLKQLEPEAARLATLVSQSIDRTFIHG